MPPEPANDGGRPTPRTVATSSSCNVVCGGPSEGGAVSLMGEVNAGQLPAPKFFFLKASLLSALSAVGAACKAYTSNEILSLLKAYVVQHKLLDTTSQTVKCKGTSLEEAFQVQEFQFEYSDVRRLLLKHVICASYVRPAAPTTSPAASASLVAAPTSFSTAATSYTTPFSTLGTTPLSNTPFFSSISSASVPVTPTLGTQTLATPFTSINTCSASSQTSSSQGLKPSTSSSPIKFKIPIPEIPDSLSGPESEYSNQGYETSLCKFSDGSVSEEEEEVVEYEPASEFEEEGSNTHNDSDSDVENGLLLILGVDVPQNLDEDFFADESESSTDSESDGNNTEDETDRWPCLKCGIRNKPFMRYCLKCWQLRKDWFPDPPRRLKKRKPRTKKNKRRKRLGGEGPLALQRTVSTTSSSTTISTVTSSQDSGFGSQYFGEEDGSRKRRFSDLETDDEEQLETEAKRTFSEATEYCTSVTSHDEVAEFQEKVNSSDCEAQQNERSEFKKMGGVSNDKGRVSNDKGVEIQKRGGASEIVGDSFGVAEDDDDDVAYGGRCSLCCTRPKNASIIHGRISHISFCYPCAKRLYNSKSKCPICRRKIHMVTKNIIH